MEDKIVISPLQVRLPADLKQWLKHRAVDNFRSTNGELVTILKEVRDQERSQEAQQ